MEQYVIKGGTPLRGEVTIGGAKNAALAILAAAVMTDDTVVIDNLPDVRDVNVMIGAMEDIGASIERVDRHTVRINGSKNILRRFVLPIIYWERCLVSISLQR